MDILSHHRTVEGVSREKQESAQREVNAVIDQAQKAMEDADLDSARDSMDSVFFWSLAQLIPTEKDGVPVSMDDQIAYCIDAVKNYKTKSLETHKTEETSGPAKPVTLSSVVDAIADSRRI